MNEDARGGGKSRVSISVAAAWWVGFFVAWVLLTGTLDTVELIAGFIAATVAAAVAEVVRIQDFQLFRPRARWLMRARRLPRNILADCGVVFGALYRHVVKREHISGAFRAFEFEPGGDDGRSAARRALVNVAISLSPNTYVVEIDRTRRLILVHQLVPSPKELAREEILGRL
jgi:multisubunit Na+/H+ antiporter MnhE subunit